MMAMDLRTDMYRCVQETMTLRFPPRYFVHLGQPDDHGPNSWSAIKPTMASLIGQESDDHVLNERLVNYTTNMAYLFHRSYIKRQGRHIQPLVKQPWPKHDSNFTY